MLKLIKRRYIQSKTERNIRSRDLSKINEPLHKLGFIVDEREFIDFEELYAFSRLLDIQRKDIRIFSFLETKLKQPTLRQNQVYHKDFTWQGEITNKNAIEFLDYPFDVMIGYYKGSNEFLNLMMSASRSKFKVGLADADPRLFDLIIKVQTSDMNNFRLELKRYMQILNKI